MSQRFEVIVVGLGAMGSSALRHLSRRGIAALGLDRFTPPHDRGSSHGQSRIIRRAYFETPGVYVPLVDRSLQLWSEIAEESGRELFRQTGVLLVGDAYSQMVSKASETVHTHQIPHEHLSGEEVNQRFPAFDVPGRSKSILEPQAGILFPETSIETQIQLAVNRGATVRFKEPVQSWEAMPGGVRVRTSEATYEAGSLILSCGAWISQMVPQTPLPLTVERQLLFWFEPKSHPEFFKPGRMPTFILEPSAGRFCYGMPDLGEGVKVAIHHEGDVIDPDSDGQPIAPAEVGAMRDLLSQYLPEANGLLRKSEVCRYTNSPDEHFIVDRHPQHPNIVLLSACSGHGFKFSPVMGEIAADLVEGVTSPLHSGFFSLSRFLQGSQ